MTLHYPTLITPHNGYNCNCPCNYKLHYTTTPLRYSYNYTCNYNCTTLHPAVVVT